MQMCCLGNRQTCMRRQLGHIDSFRDLLGLLICLLLLLLRLRFYLMFFQHTFFFLWVG